MSTQPAQASASGHPAGSQLTGSQLTGGEAAIRASDADRDRTAGVLNAAFAEGRLTAEEHRQRLDDAYAARGWSQLHQLTADLPAPSTAGRRAAMPEVPAQLDWCLLCLLLIACPPAGLAWWLRSRRQVTAQAERRAERLVAGQESHYAQDR